MEPAKKAGGFPVVARIVMRGSDPTDGLGLIALFQGGQESLKPNTVYDVRDYAGVLTIVEVGPSVMSSEVARGSLLNWECDVTSILNEGKYVFLTEAEFRELIERGG